MAAADDTDGAGRGQAAPRSNAEGIAPWRDAVYVVTAWNPGGQPRSPKENGRRQRELLERLDELGLEVTPATGLSPDGSWAEASSAITGMSRDTVLELGREFGQLAIFEWTKANDGLRVVRCDSGRAYRSGWTSTALDLRPCPMQPPADRATDLCTMPGGPWVSASQRVATEWTVRRSTMLRALGCDVCKGDAVHGVGTPIVLASTQDPARADTGVWLPR